MGTNLLHDTGLALREGDVATRLISDELDLNLSPLATRLVIIIIIVVGRGRALALDATVLACLCAAIPDSVFVEGRGRRWVVLVGDVGHGGDGRGQQQRAEVTEVAVECEV